MKFRIIKKVVDDNYTRQNSEKLAKIYVECNNLKKFSETLLSSLKNIEDALKNNTNINTYILNDKDLLKLIRNTTDKIETNLERIVIK